ncbi:uncharacterized protein LOC143921596 [Arctopsyche grandis]|uniref:uncharacterized protein LOC143921596 n=1 Tax=Arctopsyche grandis TaxID=121162 RepID=UPI00406D9CA1
MSADENAKAQASKILGLSKETELLHSFVRIDLGANDEKEKDPRSGHRPLHIPKQTSLEIGGDTDKDRGHSPRHKTISGKAIFKQIKKEMKNKGNRRRRVRREEEVYTDKDRAAAVNMGSKDIKSSLNAKLRQDKTKALSLPDEADPGTLLALGRNELRTGNFNNAIGFVNKALELNPDEKSALVARSKCYLLLGEPRLALEDAEAALKMDKTYIKAIYQKAEALYFLGDFELSLMFFHRGLRARPELEGFRLGVQKAQEAIENTIGSSKPLRATPVKQGKKVKDPDKKLSRQLLGQLYVDKEYLENLLKNPDLNVADRKTNNIAVHAEEAVQFLNKRQEFWRQQRPTATASGRKKIIKNSNLGPFPKWYDNTHQITFLVFISSLGLPIASSLFAPLFQRFHSLDIGGGVSISQERGLTIFNYYCPTKLDY